MAAFGREMHCHCSVSEREKGVRALFASGILPLFDTSEPSPQTVVVLCFNEMDHLSYQQIRSPFLCLLSSGTLPRSSLCRNETNISDSGELDRTLLSLSCGKPGTRILIKEPKGKDVRPSDTFRFDENFSNKLFRIKINTIQVPCPPPPFIFLDHSSSQLKETVEEVEKTKEEVFRDRQYEVTPPLCLL